MDKRRAILFGVLTVVMAIAAWAYTFAFNEIELHRQLLIPFSFVSLGMLIKYGDQAFDEDVYSRRMAVVLAIPGGMWMGSLMIIDIDSRTIFIGLLLALMIAAKYDNLAFKIGFAIAGGVGAALIILEPASIEVLGIALVFAAALVDEKVNDLKWVNEGNRVHQRILRERPFLKLAILAMCLLSVLSSYLYLFAFLGFDFGYSFVESLSSGPVGDRSG